MSDLLARLQTFLADRHRVERELGSGGEPEPSLAACRDTVRARLAGLERS